MPASEQKMIVDCQISAVLGARRPLEGIATAPGLEAARRERTTSGEPQRRSQDLQRRLLLRRRRGRRKEEAATKMEEARDPEPELMMKKIKQTTTTTTSISDQTLALGNSHYEDESSISWRQWRPLTSEEGPPAGRGHMTKRRRRRLSSLLWPRRGSKTAARSGLKYGANSKLAGVILFTATLMILTAITLANTFTGQPMWMGAISNATTSCNRTLAAAGPASRTMNDGPTDEDCRHRVQSTIQPELQLSKRQQQQEIPFKTPVANASLGVRQDQQAEGGGGAAATTTSATSSAATATAAAAAAAAAAATSTTTTTTNTVGTATGSAAEVGRQLVKRAPAEAGNTSGRVVAAANQPLASLQAQHQFLQQLQVGETDLLPYSDFSVQQPAFSDIMKSWPPTTTRQRQQQTHDTDNYNAGGGSKRQRGNAHRRGHFGESHSVSEEASASGQWQIRNHLNEDFDDTIVTADEAFEQDQLPEPPALVNYLGELGDLIYTQLSQLASGGPASVSDGSAKPLNGSAAAKQQQRAAIIEDLLDDFYYDQYENSQVLYYGPQLVRQGDIFEIGCYLPNGQPAEWTKSGRSIVGGGGGGGPARGNNENNNNNNNDDDEQPAQSSTINPLRVIKRTDFMGAKQNYSLKVFEAQLSDSGNYRCTRLSRKYHKLIVVPAKSSLSQQYLYQQRLLSIVGQTWSQRPDEDGGEQLQLRQRMSQVPALYHQRGPTLSQQQVVYATLQQTYALLKLTSSSQQHQQLQQPPPQQRSRQRSQPSPSSGRASKYSTTMTTANQPLTLMQIVREHQPMAVQCHIEDELIVRKLRETPQFQLAWYKNGRLLLGSQQQGGSGRAQQSSSGRQNPRADLQQQQQQQQHQQAAATRGRRVEFLGPNGRQMFIHSANYADAGEYLCSWAKLTELLRQQEAESASNSANPSGDDSQSDYTSTGVAPSSLAASSSAMGQHPASAASHHQLVVPVKLRPFKSAYHVRAGNQLRIICQVQRGYPAAFISWYVGNQLVDAEFLRDHPNEFRVLHLQTGVGGVGGVGGGQSRSAGGSVATSNGQAGSSATDEASRQQQDDPESQAQIVEINPIPAGRQQMQLTTNGRGQWVEYRDLTNDKYALDSQDHQTRYLQTKLAQLTGTSWQPQPQLATEQQTSSSAVSSPGGAAGPLQQAGLSVLVVDRLQSERHTSRYACRATGRANTDEVTTVIRVKDSSTYVKQPLSKAATLIPGQPLHFECGQTSRRNNAQFKWYKKALNQEEPVLLEPNSDDNLEIHNEKLTLLKPTYQSIGDYICMALNDRGEEKKDEYGTIQVRAAPYVEDFGVETSHTGQSATLNDGDRLELMCRVRDQSVPVNITWLMSDSPEREVAMVVVPEYDSNQLPSSLALQLQQPTPGSVDILVPTFTVPNNVMVEKIDSFNKRLIIRQVGPEHRGHYTCVADNGVTERTSKIIYIRVKDKILPLWPFLGILAELFILFTIIYVWETQKAQKSLTTNPKLIDGPPHRALGMPQTPSSTAGKRPASGPSNASESVPLNG